MPVTGYDLRGRNDYAPLLGQVNTTSFLFDDDDKEATPTMAPSAAKGILQMKTTSDNFPMLVGGERGLPFVASSTASNLAASQTEQPSGWPSNFSSINRSGQQSGSTKDPQGAGLDGIMASSSLSASQKTSALESGKAKDRRSLEVKFELGDQSKRPGLTPTTTPKLQTSYSANDIPTMKSVSALSNGHVTNNHAELYLHKHNASIGRIPANVTNKRFSTEIRESPSSDTKESNPYRSASSGLQADAVPFGPAVPANKRGDPPGPTMNGSSYASQAYGGYGMQMMNVAMQNLSMSNRSQYNGQPTLYHPYPVPTGYQNAGYAGASNRDVGHHRPQAYPKRGQNSEGKKPHAILCLRHQPEYPTHTVAESSRYNSIPLENLQGEIYGLCKDQHGCRYLQKKLEEKKPEQATMIFNEVRNHVVELMTGKCLPPLPSQNSSDLLQTPSATIFARSCSSMLLKRSVRC